MQYWSIVSLLNIPPCVYLHCKCLRKKIHWYSVNAPNTNLSFPPSWQRKARKKKNSSKTNYPPHKVKGSMVEYRLMINKILEFFWWKCIWLCNFWMAIHTIWFVTNWDNERSWWKPIRRHSENIFGSSTNIFSSAFPLSKVNM